MAHDVRSDDVSKISAKELLDQIKLLLLDPFNPAFQKFRAIYVIGKRGTGKTEITRQVVQQMNNKDKDIHYVLVEEKLNKYYDASDFIGHSFIDIKKKEMTSAYPALLRETEKQLEEYISQTEKIDPVQKDKLLSELKKIQEEEDKQKRAKKLADFCKENKFCVTYFLDEVSAVPPQIIEPIARFVREGKLGDCVVPYGYKIVLAGNYSEEMGDLDYKHPLMLMDRMPIFYYEPTLEEYLTYFKKSPHSHPAIVAFLTHYPESFLQYENHFSTSSRRIEDLAIELSKLEQSGKQDIKHLDTAVKNLIKANFPTQIANSFYSFYITAYSRALQFVEKIAEEFSKGAITGEDLSSLSDEKIKEMALSLLFYLKKEQFNLSIKRLPLYVGAVLGMYYLIGQLHKRNLKAGLKEIIASLTSCAMALRNSVGELVDIMTKFTQNPFEKALEKHIDKILSKGNGESISYEKIQELYLSMEKDGQEFFELLNKAQSLEPGTILLLSSALSKLIECVKETYIKSLHFKDYVDKGHYVFYSEAEEILNEIVPSSSIEFDLNDGNKNKIAKSRKK